MSIKKAARAADISDTRWRQIEQGFRMHRGKPEAEPPAPAPILARMARAVEVTPAELESVGRGDAAAELAAMPERGMNDADMYADLSRRLLMIERQLGIRQRTARLTDREDEDDEDNGKNSRAV
jgi:hypothetical protein